MDEQRIQSADAGEVSRVLDFAMKAGKTLLENGAEISRVEDTMQRIAKAFGVEHDSFFVLSNGIFTTGWDAGNTMPGSFAKVAHIPLQGMRMDRIVAVNQLSREICAGKYTLEEAIARLNAIRSSRGKPVWAQLAAAALGSGAFSIIFGGSMSDALVSAIAGLLVWLFVLYVGGRQLSKITGNIIAAALATVICLGLRKLGLGDNLGQMVIGGVITLIPGVALTNGVHDIAEADYISGIVRLLDAMLGFLCIGVGVGIVFILFHRITGGVLR